ncbi:MAG: TetR family transcriptional regulator [Gordonia sp. (in: high G+C Gram-positive bacteria)]|uniref:TetR/AcrR family transcriptional regulator n=1 Tax=Gordonia sp. (in: high G+C Gram-positive bacteria) TaxID=84139 RepID=UPI0039E456E7
MPAALTDEQRESDRGTVLDAIEPLVYARGVQAVGMDEIREASGLSLARIYGAYPSKDAMVTAMLKRRDARWRSELAAAVDHHPNQHDKVVALFDWLHDWFASSGFRGCAWINVNGEYSPSSPEIAAEVRRHKAAFAAQIDSWIPDPATADAVYLLAEGAMATAGITGDPEVARRAQSAALRLLG